MELVIRKGDLLRELQLLQGIIERRASVPILANILLKAADGEVLLLATDLDVGLRSRCEASVARPGTVTLPARKVLDIVKALPETDVRIEEDQGGVKLAADRFESRMSTLPADDFPALPAVPEGAASEVLPGGVLRLMVELTQFAITGEDTRYFLNGALFLIRPESMSLVATDGHRLALVTVPRVPAGERAASQVILPKKLLGELSRLLGEHEGEVVFTRGDNHLFFEVGGRLLMSRVIDGQFPAYERVIPKTNDKRIDFDRDRLASAVRRVAILSNERSRAVRFAMGPGHVEITSSSPEFGEAREQLAVDYDGPEMQVCFNANYILEFLGVVGTERVTLEFKDDVSQALLRPLPAERHEYLYVVMPMRI
jgi:DNA polymerase-3 subunit beta